MTIIMKSFVGPLILAATFVLFVFLLVAPCADGIKCWNCNSASDPKCADPFDNTSLPIFDCDAKKLDSRPGMKASMCRKIRQKVNGYWRFIRQCAFLGVPGEGKGDENYCLMRTGTYNVFIETCTCDSKDGCNTASLQSPHMSLFFTLFVLIVVLQQACLRI